MQKTNHIYELEEPLKEQHPRIWQDIVYYKDTHQTAKLTLCVPPNLSGQKQPHYPVILFAPTDKVDRLSALLQFTYKGYAVALLDEIKQEPLKNFNSAGRFLILHAWQYQLDSNRIIAMGEGHGAYAAAGAVLGAGQQELNREDVHTLPLRFRGCLTISGKFDSPDLPNLSKLGGKRKLPPFLLIHGDNDKRVNYQESLSFFKFLDHLDTHVDLYKLKNCPHGSDAFFTPYLIDIYSKFIADPTKKGK